MILQKPAFLLWQLWRALKISGFPVKPMGQLPLNKWMVKFVTSNSKMENIQFGTGSFAEIDPEIKDQITARYEELIGSL